MKRSTVIGAVLALIAVTLLAIGFVDRPLALAIDASGVAGSSLLVQGTRLLDLATGKGISNFLLPTVLAVCGAILFVLPRCRRLARAIFFVAAVQLLSTLICGLLKPPFGRQRPFELVESGNWGHAWFVGGNSFPSGHLGFYLGLCLPIACLLRRGRWLPLLVPLFIAVGRLTSNDHFLSDLTGSAVIVLLVLGALASVAPRTTSALICPRQVDPSPASRP